MRQNVHPQLTTLPIGAGLTDATTDGVLLIGDRAIKPELGEYREIWDLGDVWCRWTELPFVYAMWVARSDGPGHLLDGVLSWSRDRGLEHLPEIAAAHAAEVGLGHEDGVAYLRDNLYFYLGPQERRGLDLYYRYAAELGLVPAGRALKFHDCSTT
jgi:chorismate dehydratase